MLINTSQINQPQLTAFVQAAAGGAAFSGNVTSYFAASGWPGPLAVAVTGAQEITGIKLFRDSPQVPYSGNTGTAPSARWVSDQVNTVSGAINTNIGATGSYLYNTLVAMSGALTGIITTGGGGGTIPPGIMYTSGAQPVTGVKTFISSPVVPSVLGGATGNAVNINDLITVSGILTGAGASSVKATGSANIAAPNFTGVGSTFVTYDGTYIRVSGSGGSNVRATGSSTIASPNFTGLGSVFVSYDGTYILVSGSGSAVGGTTNNYFITGTGVVAASSTGTVINTFNVTSGNTFVSSSGTVTNTFNGTVLNNFSISGITGNFVNMSFYFDEFTLATGLNLSEMFAGRSFFFTGYGIGAINTGTQGFFSGSFYQRTQTNTKTNFVDFYLNSGMFCSGRGGFVQEVTGMNRVGLDIYRIGTGITGLSIGLFGVGY